MNRLLYTSVLLCAAQCMNAAGREKPNIVLILCDDMGFSDLGCYGSEINTPNIDRLAKDGTMFSQFKNTGRSCPSRASLLTGRYQHEVGMGWMAEVDEHRPGYRGQIDRAYPTIAEVLKAAGYSTYMSGKWHVTTTGAYDAPNGSYPVQRGFDKYYGCLHGGGSYYKPEPLYRGLEKITDIPDDYYYTEAITDSAVSYVNSHDARKPMFLYVAHYAPHLPLEAPKEAVEKCLDRYRDGYDVLRERRFDRLKSSGLIPEGMTLPVFEKEFNGKRPAWTELDGQQREKWTVNMATYAAMIEIMDRGIGELIEAVRRKGILDNTVFIFLSDNGSTSEGGFIKQLMADLSNTPYRSYKQWCFQGGTSTPFIISFGKKTGVRKAAAICRQPAHLIDILPTCMEIAGAEYPGVKTQPASELPGTSLISFIEGKKTVERSLYFEHQSSCAIIDGSWKLVRKDMDSHWELIDLKADPFETKDLSREYPEKVEELEYKWTDWANRNKVFPLEDKPWSKRINFYKEKNSDQSGR